MNILINTSNLKTGGGIQVADSIIRQLPNFSNDHFIIVLSSALDYLKKETAQNTNCEFVSYNLPQTLKSAFWGINEFLDNIVHKYRIQRVFTIFGPPLWKSKVKHIVGFARPQIVYPESPFFSMMNIKERLISKINESTKLYNFKICSDIIITENNDVTERLKKIITSTPIYTVTNYYNQIFDEQNNNEYLKLPQFNGTTLLTISANHKHKNIQSIFKITKSLKIKYPDFNFRFVLTLEENLFPNIDEEIRKHIFFTGPVNIKQCPSLYLQSSIMFLPTLLECFSASYPEAMKMGIPILTSDLGFAHSLCGNAAYYYNPLDVNSAVDSIYELATNDNLRYQLRSEGYKQLLKFDNYKIRVEKIMDIIKR